MYHNLFRLTLVVTAIAIIRAAFGSNSDGEYEFHDPYQITWQLIVPESKLSTAGEFANRSLKL